jgi:acetolactate synthase-1/2/3 large subunit
MLYAAKAPVVFVGGGVILSNAADRLTQFARQLGVPVTMSLMGLGGFPGSDPLSLGMLGMHGTYQANMAIQNSDLIFAVGPRFDDRVTGKLETFAPKAKIVHIDVDPTSISKSIRVDIPIVGDARAVMGQFLEELERNEPPKEYFDHLEHWRGRIENWKALHALDYDRNGSRIRSQYVIETLYDLTGGDAVVATDVGQHQMWVAQFFKFAKPRTLLTSGGLGTMGFGFPAALGAKIARPNETVIAISGDGSIQMNIQELMTAVQYGIDVKVVILNNSFLGMVRQWQELFYRSRYASSCMAMVPDFVKLAEAYGAKGFSSAVPEDVVPILKEALAHKGPVIIEFRVAEEDNVYPMVPPGGSIGDMLLV